MRTLTIGFSHSKGFKPFSWAIKGWDKTPYSHVYFKFVTKSNPDIPLIYQASKTMLNFMSEQVFLTQNVVCREFEIEVTDEQFAAFLRDCMLNAGKPYGIMQIVGIFIADVFKLKKNPFPNSDKYFVCSEWVAKELEKLGYKWDKPMDLVDPKDVYKVLSKE